MKKEEPKHHHRYKKIKNLGEGAYGTVTKVYDYKQKIFIALKKVKIPNKEETFPVHALRQISFLKNHEHPNIIKYCFDRLRMYRVVRETESSKISLYLEYMSETLFDHYTKNDNLSPFAIKNYLFEILKGLQFLQRNGYMHRDLKPQNIMVGQSGTVKLIDFGQVKKINTGTWENILNTREVGTIWYKAPEILLDAPQYNHKIDVWAVGCIMAEIVTGKPLFQGLSEVDQIFKIFSCLGTPSIEENKELISWKGMSPSYPKFPKTDIEISNLEEDGLKLLRDMLSIDPRKRPSAKEAMQYKYFQALL